MKKLLFIGLAVCFLITTFFNGFAQKKVNQLLFKHQAEKLIQYQPEYPYSLTVSTREYESLIDTINLNGGNIWDDPAYLIPVGFDFEFMGLTVDSIVVGDFYVGLDYDLVYDEDWDQYYYDVYSGIDLFGADMIDFGYADGESFSEINYKLDGAAGNRILKIEWKQIGFYNEYYNLGEQDSYISFQLWIYEVDNHFEMRYGPNAIYNVDLNLNYNPGPYVDFGKASHDYSTITGYYLTGQPSAPMMNIIEEELEGTLEGIPQYGRTYFFTVGEGTTIGVEENSFEHEAEVFPNPTNGFFSIDTENYDDLLIQLYDILGNKIKDQKVNYKNQKINISTVPKGTYIVHILSENQVISTQKLIKN